MFMISLLLSDFKKIIKLVRKVTKNQGPRGIRLIQKGKNN